MSELADFEQIWLTSSNTVNGERTALYISIALYDSIVAGDSLVIGLPDGLRFDTQVNCKTTEGD